MNLTLIFKAIINNLPSSGEEKHVLASSMKILTLSMN